jgi:hypothetical protein
MRTDEYFHQVGTASQLGNGLDFQRRMLLVKTVNGYRQVTRAYEDHGAIVIGCGPNSEQFGIARLDTPVYEEVC